MAIAFARVRYLSRSSGGNAVRTAAYNARTSLQSERTGVVFSFRDRQAPLHHEVLLPEEVSERFVDLVVLWNAVEAAEHRRDSQVAREIVLALPANAEISPEDRIALARAFAEELFVSKGLAVQLDIHAPDGGDVESEEANWHAHLLITTRRLGRDGFARTKARDLAPDVRSVGGRNQVVDGEIWGELWRARQDRFFREQGSETRVDPNGLDGQMHFGPARMRGETSELSERLEIQRQVNQETARDPTKVLEVLTRTNATFTERELHRFLAKELRGEAPEEIAAVCATVLECRDLVQLYVRETGAVSGRFTTRKVREQECAAMAVARELADRKTGAVSVESARAAKERKSLRPDQAAAFEAAIGAGHLKLIEGRAGTGKSYALSVIRDAHERDGKRVVGLAPTTAVARDLAGDGFAEARTVHSALFRLKNGLLNWDSKTVVIVDEAGMMGAGIVGELLAAVNQAGAKLILAGDDRQLASIERGGLFSQLLRLHGSCEITEVIRQRVDWQRQAARDLAEYRFEDAVSAFDRNKAIIWSDTSGEARAALVEAWKRDQAAHPEESRFAFAYTNRDVDALNAELRQVCRTRGELIGPDVSFVTRRGSADRESGEWVQRETFAVGDRVQFTRADRNLRIYNGNVGTIASINAETGEITARIDGNPAREVSWNAHEYQGFQHGYAGTIYKGQGKTLDRTYLYHTSHWSAAPSYVALTRQRKSAELFVSREMVRNVSQLAHQLARNEIRAASLAWTALDEEVEEGASAHGMEVQDRIGSMVDGPAGAAPDVASGRARFREGYEAHRQQRQTNAGNAQHAEEGRVETATAEQPQRRRDRDHARD